MNAIDFDFRPTGSTSDLTHLLEIVADPAVHKKRLDELIAQESSVRERIEAHNELMAKTRGMHTAAEAAMIVATNRKAALDTREAEIEQRAKNLDSAERRKSDAGLAQREAEVSRRESAVSRRETTIGEREAAFETKLALVKKAHAEASL